MNNNKAILVNNRDHQSIVERNPRNIFGIDIGSLCNNNCLFCADGKHRVNFEPKKSILKKIQENSHIKKLLIAYSEPTLNPNLLEYIRYAKECKYETICLSTNGRMLTYSSFVKELLKAGMNEITISIHGHNAIVHQASSRTPNSFIEVKKAIENLSKERKKTKFEFLVATTVSKLNVSHLKNICIFLNNFNIDGHILNFVEPRGYALNRYKILAPKVTKFIEMINQVKEKMPNYPLIITEMPFCAMGKYVKEVGIKEKEFVNNKSEKTIERNRNTLYQKFDFCNKCVYNHKCKGVWCKYLEIYGTNEFNPIK